MFADNSWALEHSKVWDVFIFKDLYGKDVICSISSIKQAWKLIVHHFVYMMDFGIKFI